MSKMTRAQPSRTAFYPLAPPRPRPRSKSIQSSQSHRPSLIFRNPMKAELELSQVPAGVEISGRRTAAGETRKSADGCTERRWVARAPMRSHFRRLRSPCIPPLRRLPHTRVTASPPTRSWHPASFVSRSQHLLRTQRRRYHAARTAAVSIHCEGAACDSPRALGAEGCRQPECQWSAGWEDGAVRVHW